jgi:hypothetical protein
MGRVIVGVVVHIVENQDAENPVLLPIVVSVVDDEMTHWIETTVSSTMYAETPRASSTFFLVQVSVMLIAPEIRSYEYTPYPPLPVVLNHCVLWPEHVRRMVTSQTRGQLQNVLRRISIVAVSG